MTVSKSDQVDLTNDQTIAVASLWSLTNDQRASIYTVVIKDSKYIAGVSKSHGASHIWPKIKSGLIWKNILQSP
jgi:hypothetical protein